MFFKTTNNTQNKSHVQVSKKGKAGYRPLVVVGSNLVVI